MSQKSSKLFKKAAWLSVIALTMLIFTVFFDQNQQVDIARVSYEALPTATYADVGQIILADCAKTACVATKAADLAAQAEAERQAKLPKEVAQVDQAESYTQIPSTSIGNITDEAVQPVVVPKPEFRLVLSVLCNDGTKDKDDGKHNPCEGHGGVRGPY